MLWLALRFRVLPAFMSVRMMDLEMKRPPGTVPVTEVEIRPLTAESLWPSVTGSSMILDISDDEDV